MFHQCLFIHGNKDTHTSQPVSQHPLSSKYWRFYYCCYTFFCPSTNGDRYPCRHTHVYIFLHMYVYNISIVKINHSYNCRCVKVIVHLTPAIQTIRTHRTLYAMPSQVKPRHAIARIRYDTLRYLAQSNHFKPSIQSPVRRAPPPLH